MNISIQSVTKKKKSGTNSKYIYKANIFRCLQYYYFFFLAKRINSCDVLYCFSISSSVGNLCRTKRSL